MLKGEEAVLVSVAPVVTGGCADACVGVMLAFEGHAALGAILIWVAYMATGAVVTNWVATEDQGSCRSQGLC